MLRVRDVVYRVNQQYIASAAQDDRYRTEPPFRLQGSYRNMNKLAEKISPVMNEDELQQLISDHYLGEAQLLTTGAEENLLKLAELRGVLDDTQASAGRRSSATSCATRPWGPTTAMSAGAWSRSWPTSPPPCNCRRRRRKRLPLPTRHRGRRCWRPCIVFLKHVRRAGAGRGSRQCADDGPGRRPAGWPGTVGGTVGGIAGAAGTGVADPGRVRGWARQQVVVPNSAVAQRARCAVPRRRRSARWMRR
jgi:hypothetical protein